MDGFEDNDFANNSTLRLSVPGGSAEAKAMRVLADGKILLAGTVVADGVRKLFTARLLSTGALDTAYGSGGFQVAPSFPAAFPTDSIPVVRLEADGQLFAASTSWANSKVALAHWLGGAGGFNPGFSGDGVAFTAGTFANPTSLARRADGRLFISADNRFGAATCTFDGASDNRLGTGGVSTSTVTTLTNTGGCVRLQADGKILVAGTAVMPNGSNTTMDFVVARYQTDGTPSAPTIVTPPVAQTVYGGFPASFTVAVDADNTSPPAFQWKRNGQPIEGATAATHSIAAAQASDEGSITVEVSNLLGTAVSEPVALTVNVQPHIVTAPVAVSGMHNTMVELCVTVTGGIPLTYQWHRGTTDYPAEVSSSFTNKLALPADEANEGSYTVTISNTGGTVTSDPVTLNALPSPPEIVTEPANVQVNSAASGYAVLNVTVTSTVRPFTYQWQRNGENFHAADTTSIPHSTLLLPADLVSSGTSRCIITNADGTATSAGATITIVPQPPVITVEPEPVTGVADGGYATLSVTVTGRAPYTYEWRRNGESFSSGNMTPSTTGNLAVPKLTAGNGLYQCIVTNSDGMATSEEVLVFFQPNGTIRQRTQHLLLNEGDLIMLLADVFSSHPVLKYEWQFNGRKVVGAASQHDNELFLEVSFASAGNYRLLAGTVAGTLVSNNTAMAVVENRDRTVVAAAGKPVTSPPKPRAQASATCGNAMTGRRWTRRA